MAARHLISGWRVAHLISGWRVAGRIVLTMGLLGSMLTVTLGAAAPRPLSSSAPFNSEGLSFVADDGVALHLTLGWFGSLAPRPLIVEDSPYAPQVSSLDWSGAAYNYAELQWRGTGSSGGSLDSTGPRDQQDLSEFLAWACRQPWSDQSIGLYGFSASAIVVYNSMHLPLPCVKAAALMSGTVDLYRDLLYIGGVPSPVVGSAVEGMILAPWLEDFFTRATTEPVSVAGSLGGFARAPVSVGANMTEDRFWLDRTFQGDPNHIPVLADDGFYDVEERGAFHAFLATQADGSHLLVMGAHDGFPAGSSPFPQYTAWFDHYLLGAANGVNTQPAVQAWLSNGSREQFLADTLTQDTMVSGSGWPLSDTTWNELYLSPATNGSVQSLNDGTLALAPDPTTTSQSYPFLPSEGTETDPHTVATVAGDGLDQAASYFPALTDMDLSGPTSLTYTTPVLKYPVDAVGPVGLDLYASSTQPFTDLVAVVADVWPDGTAYPVATGWLRTLYPGYDPARSIVDPAGDVVDPYTDFSAQDPALPGAVRQYHLEVLPIGNHFAAGHRIRLYILGTPGDMQWAPPGLDTLTIGGAAAARLTLPTVGTSLCTALGQCP
jgi:predicted acyl esterase